MRKKIEWQWEQLDESTWRAKVIGGWVLKVRMFIEGKRGVVMSESMTFIPDRDHEWHIIPPVVPETAKKIAQSEDFEPRN